MSTPSGLALSGPTPSGLGRLTECTAWAPGQIAHGC